MYLSTIERVNFVTKTNLVMFHYQFCCNYFETERKRHLKLFFFFYKRPNIIKLKELLASANLKGKYKEI